MLKTRNINLCSGDIASKRLEIKEYFLAGYSLFEKVFDVLADDSVFYERPERRRHQLIFYFGHTASFYINKLILGGYLKKRLNSHFESIFAIGVDEMAWDDLNCKNYNWPSVDEVRQYREDVKQVVIEFIDSVEFSLPITFDSPMWAVMMGCEHERIHIETSSVLHRQLDISKIKSDSFWQECKDFGEAPTNDLIFVGGCEVNLGKDKKDCFYGWDNEYGQFTSKVDDFKASKYLVSNGEFLEFVQDGGYKKDEFWSEEGCRWKNYEQVFHPTFWILKDEKYFYRSFTAIYPLPLNFPVDVNCLEAQAFCAWKSKQTNSNITLPSEAMWHRLRDVSGVLDEPFWADKAPANINLEYFASSTPVDKFAHGEFFDVIGNVWQWTSTPIDNFDGFEVHPLYDDFSTPTFDGKHAIIKGGSWISTGNEVLKNSRYAFRRHFYQHAGFRYVEVKQNYQSHFTYIEKDAQIIKDIKSQYEMNEKFYEKLMIKVQSCLDGRKIHKALDLGCGVGRIGFELARFCNRVFAIDFSARFIKVADTLKKDGCIKYENKVIYQKDLKLDIVDTTKLEYWQGDACNLKPLFKDFDFVIAHDLLDFLYDKQKFNLYFKDRVLKDTIAIFSSKKTNVINLPNGFQKIDEFVLDDYKFVVSKKI